MEAMTGNFAHAFKFAFNDFSKNISKPLDVGECLLMYSRHF